MCPQAHMAFSEHKTCTILHFLVPWTMQILMVYGGRSPIISDQSRHRQGTAYCSVAHLWLLVCPSIRFHIDGRVQAPTKVRTRGPQAERGRGPHGRSSQHERDSHLSLEVARGAVICRLAEAAGTFSQREWWAVYGSSDSDRVHQAPKGPH